ncbi:fatty acid oxidation complex subunit alpha FadJ [Paraferrimonas sp. SM1919]|uniref:fatty acid oxidation complex subunit alpha FadJ n=1 Tax=Paraferrimonas sp. SM1919 TaxID=2662263 RepID=UPI0013D45C8B|nr:fatty acid oxidation complex subunit alpha FadJ [Paraferrimonas sp. SM1919]
MNIFNLQVKDNGCAFLTINDQSESVNTLKTAFSEEVTQIIEQIQNDSNIKGLVIASGKKDSFIVGADINMLAACQTETEAYEVSKAGHQLFDALAALPFPTVAAVNGMCLGGGLELALACDHRVAADTPKCVLGVPEVQLGLLPGGGGTQRLPKLVGIPNALDMMLTGKQIRAKKALKMGLVDEVAPVAVLNDVAEKIALKQHKLKPFKLPLAVRLMASVAPLKAFVLKKATEKVLSQTKGNYPAPIAIIACVAKLGGAKGYDFEARQFAKLVVSNESASLRQLFFATTEMKKEYQVEGKVENLWVIGGGLMGGGISAVSSLKAKASVRVKDIAETSLAAVYQYLEPILNKRVKRRIITQNQLKQALNQVTTSTSYDGIGKAEFAIEAVFEKLEIKQQVLAEIEAKASDELIFASNTSSIPISQIAQNAIRPDKVIGLHYFSPVEKMPLAEVIPHEGTSAETINKTMALAKAQGKTPILVKDKAGFYVNRILGLYINEAAFAISEGQPIDKIDNEMANFGFPLGPFKLLDQVGLDIGAHITPILIENLGHRFTPTPLMEKLIADDRKGKKNNRGFYYFDKKRKNQVDDSVYAAAGLGVATKPMQTDISDRLLMQMLNEAARCLEEEVIASPRDGDIGAIFGIGFPPFLGGPFWHMDKVGVQTIVAKLKGYQQLHGDRFEPCQLLLEMAKSQAKFYS